MSFVELHFHLLPGVDDGPSCVEESIALAAAAAAEGTRTVVATPHVHAEHITDPTQITARVQELAVRLRHEHIDLEVLAGGELAHDMVARLTDRDLDAIAQGPRGRRWLLLEAPFSGLDEAFTSAANEIRARGFAVIVAHPERAAPTPETGAVLRHESEAGSALQVTAWSIAGVYGERVRRSARRLLQSPMPTVIASDAHGRDRMPALRLAVLALTAAGEADAERFVGAIPRGLLAHGLPVQAGSVTR